jgi:DNA polymerase I-like protein with 3'-5' exonuclease and polymerase domains
MKLITLDFESYWDTHHTLSKMSPTEYVMHEDTEIQSVSIKMGTSPTYVLFGEDNIRQHLQAIDWSDALVVGHNMSGFDAMILAWRFGINPKMYGCTAAMARSQYSKTGYNVGGKFLTGVSLKKLAAELGVGVKLDLEATNTKGKKLRDFTAQELHAMEEYNKVDTDLCYEIFKTLYPTIPKQEMLLIDMTTRMLVEPKFVLDYDMVENALVDVKAEKKQSLLDLASKLGLDTAHAATDKLGLLQPELEEEVRTMLASAAKFGALLNDLGVETPMKVSPTNPNKMTPALAKTDDEFIALQNHSNPLVAAAARARLEVKSTLLETRLQAFTNAADACDGKLPVPLKYAGADTTGRWSGEQYNMQNLPRIGPKPKPSDALRKSLRAPKGHKVVVADLSGIELRVNHFLWKVPSSMALFQADPEKADLYKDFASSLYDVSKADVTKDQRQVGKVAHLGLGFGAGATTFKKVAKLMAGIDLSDGECVDVVNKWREEYYQIAEGWQRFQACLPYISQGTEEAIDPWGMCVTEHQAVRLPSGRRIHYPSLIKERDERGKTEWWYGNGRTRARIYAGKGVENLVQALARDVIAEHAVEFYKLAKHRPALMVHDELVYVVPDNEAQATLDALQNIMRKGVSWWPELVTWSEGDVADCYGEAK